jgi:hypothetical protein
VIVISQFKCTIIAKYFIDQFHFSSKRSYKDMVSSFVFKLNNGKEMLPYSILVNFRSIVSIRSNIYISYS